MYVCVYMHLCVHMYLAGAGWWHTLGRSTRIRRDILAELNTSHLCMLL
jgi:hypothetical protein